VLEARPGPADEAVDRARHRTIRQVTEQVPEQQYNTAIAAMMEYLNVVREGGRTARPEELEALIVMVAPFAPHVAEELWVRLGHKDGLFDSAQWPDFDEAMTVATSAEVAVQVNGKLRGSVTLPTGADQVAALAAARTLDNVARHLDGKTVRKVIHVPDKLINVVVS
jgi:leucyl-tRNA synthetase